MARSRWCTILNGSSRPNATSASPIRGATHSGSISKASRKLAAASSRRPRFRRALPTASMASGFSGAASKACLKRERASSIRPSLARVSPCSRYSSYSITCKLNQMDECVQSSGHPIRKRRDLVKNLPAVTRLEIRYQDPDPYGHVNNAVYLEFFESIHFAYWRAQAALVGINELEAMDVPGARYVIAET